MYKIAKHLKQIKGSSRVEGITTMWNNHTVKLNEPSLYAKIIMNFTDNTLNERSQKQSNTYFVFSLTQV